MSLAEEQASTKKSKLPLIISITISAYSYLYTFVALSLMTLSLFISAIKASMHIAKGRKKKLKVFMLGFDFYYEDESSYTISSLEDKQEEEGPYRRAILESQENILINLINSSILENRSKDFSVEVIGKKYIGMINDYLHIKS